MFQSPVGQRRGVGRAHAASRRTRRVPGLLARGAALASALLLCPAAVLAQADAAADPAQDDPALRFRMPTVTVTARKEPEDRQKVPVSVTAVSRETLGAASVTIVSDAAILAPNTFFTELSARKLSNARFRGIGSSPNNPAITTYIDGVPQLNANTSSIELLDIDQIEFVRGPQSALYGRNTLGGLISVNSVRPSRTAWTGAVAVPVANRGSWALRASASGPVNDTMSIGVSAAQVSRNGFTVNDATGREIDERSAFSAKAQLLWTPAPAWETRVIVNGERARDGDYALNDVAALRARPFHANRDFEGSTERDVVGTTVLARYAGPRLVFSSTTGFLNWQTRDRTDLDYTPMPLLTRDNTEEAFQFTQELRVASVPPPSGAAQVRWQGGVFLFTQSYDQDAINHYAPSVVAPIPLDEHSPLATLDDVGIGVFGQATVALGSRLDVSGGARIDYEDRSATLQTFYDPAIAPGRTVDADRSFSNVSPHASIAFRVLADQTLYATVGRGYKAGGFNPAAPGGLESYDEERTWHLEGGVKTLLAEGRLSVNAAAFYIDWSDLQLNVPNPAIPAQFYVANVGSASSQGVEVELNARAAPGVDLFTSFGYTRARFGAESVSSGVNVGGNEIPNTPRYTTSAGLQYTRPMGRLTLQGRAEAAFYGALEYDDQNTLGQDAYSLVNIRLGLSGKRLGGELFIRNAFDTRYIPFAFAYANFAPSGFVGEMGAPRIIGASVTLRF